MANKLDYKVLRKFAQGIMDHLGKEEEGEDPSLPDPETDDTAGQNPKDISKKSLASSEHFQFGKTDGPQADGKKFSTGDSKKRKDAAMALLATNLASKFNK